MPDKPPTQHCALCRRRARLTFHHLIPRSQHSNKWFRKNFTRERMAEGIDLCRDCHSAVHQFIPDRKQMGRYYNTREKLLAHPHVANFVGWVSRRSTNRVRTRRVRSG